MERGECDWGGGCEDAGEGREWELCHLERSWWSQEYEDLDSLHDWVGNSVFPFPNMVHNTFSYLHTPSYVHWFQSHIQFHSGVKITSSSGADGAAGLECSCGVEILEWDCCCAEF